jgi:hypothetical protein
MATFTFDRPDFGGMLDELNAGYIVILTKANGAAIILQHGNDTDENGDEIIRFTIRPKESANNAAGIATENLPISAGDLCDFLEGLEFTNYETLEA